MQKICIVDAQFLYESLERLTKKLATFLIQQDPNADFL